MNASKSRYCQYRKEKEGKSCLVFSLAFAGFRKGLSAENRPISTGRNDRLKQGKLLNLM